MKHFRFETGGGRMIRIAFCAVLGLFMASGSARAQEPLPIKSPNLLVILVDDLRSDCLGYAGNSVIRTPNLDQLAAESANLRRFFVTTPLCSPSRATLLTGLYSHQAAHGVPANRAWHDFRSGTPTLASLFNNLDYRTTFVGKAHLGGDPRAWGFQETPIWLPSGSTGYDDPQLELDGRWFTAAGNITHIFTNHTLRALRRLSGSEKPWFLFFSTTAPHGPYCCEEEFPYDREEIEASPPPGLPPGTDMSTFEWPAYYSAISDLDAQVGRILAELDRLGMRDNTFVLFTSDHGLMAGSHGVDRIKTLWYNESIKAPALLRGPGIPAGPVDNPIMNIDLLPTFFDLVGVSSPSGLPGSSFLPTILNGEIIHNLIFAEGETQNGAVPRWEMVRAFEGVAGGFKYVVEPMTGVERLYDLRSDPFELEELVAPGTAPTQTLDRLRLLHTQWRTATQ